MSTTRTLMTADELLTLPRGKYRYELVKGELLQMAPAGFEHGTVSMRFAIMLGQFVMTSRLGEVTGPDTGFKIASDPDTVRAPDVAFVRRERIQETGRPQGFWPGAPDLAVEVISPGDTYTAVEEKVNDWLEAGTRMVIVMNPRTRTMMVYRSPAEVTRLTESDTLALGDVVAGFSCRVSELFA